MNIDINDIKNGSLEDNIVWICSYHRRDLDKKPLRNIPPTKVMVRSSDTTNRKIYYSNYHFVTLTKLGTLGKKVIAPFDNTGYRTYSGNPVNVFETEAECIKCWNQELYEVCLRLDNKIKNAANYWQCEKDVLLGRMVL